MARRSRRKRKTRRPYAALPCSGIWRKSTLPRSVCEALVNAPENLTALFELVKCAYGLELFDEAERHLRNYLRYHPADMKILFSLAGVLIKMDKRNEALEKIETILLFDPKFEGAWEMQQMIGKKLPIAV